MAGKRWVWDLYPLAKGGWGNRKILDDGTPAGQTTVDPRSRRRKSGVYINNGEPIYQNYVFRRRAYIPTEDDLTIVRRWRPNDDPCCPAWFKIKAELGTDLDPDELAKLDKCEAPAQHSRLPMSREPSQSRVIDRRFTILTRMPKLSRNGKCRALRPTSRQWRNLKN
jgi:hypothetical protein